jgi:lysophospholipase L1-like esterase
MLSRKIVLVIFIFALVIVPVRSQELAADCFSESKTIFLSLPPMIGDFEKAEVFETFSGETLYNYVNGQAPYYFDQGFVCLGVQEYRNDKQSLLLELYQFKSPAGAHAIFVEETAASKITLDIGESGYLENCYLAFLYGEYFAKIMCFSEWKGNEDENKSGADASDGLLVELGRSLETVLIDRSEKNPDSSKKNKNVVLIGASYARGWSLFKFNGMEVVNKGESGEQSFEMLERFQEDVISLQPEAVIIWGFINDIFRSKRENIVAAKERAKNSFKEMVRLSVENGIIPILTTEVTVRGKDSWKETIGAWIGGLTGKKSYQDYINQNVLEMNQWIRDYAKENELLLLDLQPVIADNKGKRKKEYATEDGSHISDKGYEKLTKYATKVLNEHFRE